MGIISPAIVHPIPVEFRDPAPGVLRRQQAKKLQSERGWGYVLEDPFVALQSARAYAPEQKFDKLMDEGVTTGWADLSDQKHPLRAISLVPEV